MLSVQECGSREELLNQVGWGVVVLVAIRATRQSLVAAVRLNRVEVAHEQNERIALGHGLHFSQDELGRFNATLGAYL